MGRFSALVDYLDANSEVIRRRYFEELVGSVPDARGIFPAGTDTVPPSLVDALRWLLFQSPDGALTPAVARRLRTFALDFRRFGFPASAYSDFAAAAHRALEPAGLAEVPAALAIVDATADVMQREAAAADTAGIPAATAAQVASVSERGSDGRVKVVRLEAGMELSYLPGQFVPVMDAARPGVWRNLVPALPANPFGQLEFHVTDEFAPVAGSYVTLGAARGPVVRCEPEEALLIVAAGTGAAAAKALAFGFLDSAERPDVHLRLQAGTRRDHYDYRVFSALAEAHDWFSVSRAPLGPAVPPELWWGRRVVVSGASASVRAIASDLRGAGAGEVLEIAPDAPTMWA